MIEFLPAKSGPLTLLCIGAHADDIEIGCGGTLAALIAAGRISWVHWVVLSAEGARAKEAESGAASMLAGLANYELELGSFQDGFFPQQVGELKRYIERLKGRVTPDLLFTHHGRDSHQDHRLVAELAWQTFRKHTILEYEVPKYDGDLRTPNLYAPIDASSLRRKWDVLRDCYKSQANRHWFREQTFESLARIRGLECNSPTGLAEGFHARKLRWHVQGAVSPPATS